MLQCTPNLIYMKRSILLFLCSLTVFVAFGQAEVTPPQKRVRFHVGLDYSYQNTDLTLRSMSHQSIWAGHDYGIADLDQDEIDQVNDITTFNKRFSGIGIEAGCQIIGKTGSPWQIDGSIMFGLMKATYETKNNNNDTLVLKITSGMNNPAVGIKCRIDYALNQRWGVSLAPYIVYAWGKPSDIQDNMNAKVTFFNESRRYSFNYWYLRVTPMAYFNISNVRISAGPGFYYLHLSTEYQLKRVDPANGESYDEYLKSWLSSGTFLDGNLAIQWKIKPVTLNAFVAVGNNVIAHAGVAYTF